MLCRLEVMVVVVKMMMMVMTPHRVVVRIR